MDLPIIEVEFNGESHKIDFADFDSLEWRVLRLAAGLRLRDAWDGVNDYDPYAVAGLLWLLLRRDNPALEFEEVAKQVTTKHVLQRDEDPDMEPSELRRRQQLRAYLPTLAAVCHVRPWEIDLLTSAEVAYFLAFIDSYVAKDGDDGG